MGTDPACNPVDFDPAWDYRPARFSPEAVAAMRDVLGMGVWDALEIAVPTVWAVELTGARRRSMGLYIAGTSGSPHIAVHVRKLAQGNPSPRELAWRYGTTILHEGGHAYLESTGLLAEHQHGVDIEEAVETAARRAWETADGAAMRRHLDAARVRAEAAALSEMRVYGAGRAAYASGERPDPQRPAAWQDGWSDAARDHDREHLVPAWFAAESAR